MNELDQARRDLVAAERDAKELARREGLAQETTDLLHDLGEAWNKALRTGSTPRGLMSAPDDVREVWKRYRDARNALHSP